MTILWDWNGTLLDDSRASVAALNDLLAARGLKPITLAFYRAQFAFPARGFYERCGMDLAREDWDALARGYHDAYLAHARTAPLAPSARAALDLARALGWRQMILSAMRQDYLEAAVGAFGIAGYFDAVVGTDNLDGGSKLARARALAARLEPDRALVGDSLHDREVADALGARCILYAGGSHEPARLAPFAPVVADLDEAVRLLRARAESPDRPAPF